MQMEGSTSTMKDTAGTEDIQLQSDVPVALEFFNYHELLIPQGPASQTSLVISHFPNNHLTLKSLTYHDTRIVRIPRIYNTLYLSDIIPQFSTYTPGLEPAACIDQNNLNDGGLEAYPGEGNMKHPHNLDLPEEGSTNEIENHHQITSDARSKNKANEFVVKGEYDGNYFGNISLTPLVPHISSEELMPIVTKINQMLSEAYDPYSIWNFLDNALDCMSGTLYSQIINSFVFDSYCKRKLKELERYIDLVNEKFQNESRDIKVISPRRCGYLSLDIQIPRPQPGM